MEKIPYEQPQVSRKEGEAPSKKLKYTLEDLERERQWDGGFGPNNPNAWSRALRKHQRRLSEIENYLKQEGLLEMTSGEKLHQLYSEMAEMDKVNMELNMELDKLCPNAPSRIIVEYQGKKYQSRYFPIEKSRSGKTVKTWGHEWRSVEEKT